MTPRGRAVAEGQRRRRARVERVRHSLAIRAGMREQREAEAQIDAVLAARRPVTK